MTLCAAFEVYGTPAPQGSKKAFNAKDGRAMLKESSPIHAVWRNQIATVAKEQAKNHDNIALDGALTLVVVFRFKMPKNRPKAVRMHGTAPRIIAPDTDKLVRNVCDGLQAGGLICDDARICNLHASKIETTGWTGAEISIYRTDDP